MKKCYDHNYIFHFLVSQISAAEVILKFYKDQSALVTNKELCRERMCVSASNYCGLEYSYRYPKNTEVLTIILTEAVILLSFPTHERLLEWYHKVKNTLPSGMFCIDNPYPSYHFIL